METQVVVIGGGVMGTSIARELSQYKVDVTLIEKYPDVCFGLSKCANGMIYTGLNWLVSVALKEVATAGGSAKSLMDKDRFVMEGYEKWERGMLRDLDVPYLRAGVIVIARNDEELERLRRMQQMAKPEWEIKLLDRETLFSIEPNITRDAIAALYDKGHIFTIYPWDVVIALAENAKQNGVKFMLDTEVRGFSRSNGFQVVETTRGPVKTEFIVNSTGLSSPEVAKLADACNFSLKFFRGHCLITDKRLGSLVNNILYWPPTPGVSKAIQRTLSGNLRLGSIYVATDNKYEVGAIKEELETVLNRAHDLVPALSKRDIIAYYVGMRVFSARDPEEYIIGFAPNNPRFMNLVPRLPAYAPAPAIAEKAVSMLEQSGLQLSKKEDFNPCRKRTLPFRDLSDDQRREFIAQDSKWGHIVCRCEHVTEAEVVEAIRRGATTLDGVKFRTRAGMGRCQGGFCGPRVVEILAKELNIPPIQVTKKGGNSRVLLCESKTLLKVREDIAYESE